jgi:putative DNA primase/helicase
MEQSIKDMLAQLPAEERKTLLDAMLPKKIVFPDVSDKHAPKLTLANHKTLFTHYGITIRYNEMTKDYEIDIPGKRFHKDIELNVKIGHLRDLCHVQGLGISELESYVTVIGGENAYHPVRDWIDAQQWDGQDRLKEWYDTVVLETPNPLKEVMMYKWALSAVAALYYDNFSCEGVLTWQSPQGVGKTIQIENIIPREYHNVWNKDAVVIDMSNKDTIFKALGYWIAELGEVDATFRKSDMEALKGFVTEKVDVLRPPYERKANKYARRTVFYASVNELEFLQDDENRRFWVLAVRKFLHAEIDCAQFWAQMKHCYLQVANKIRTASEREKNQEWGWFMSPREREQMKPLQSNFKSVDPIEQILDAHIIIKTGAHSVGEWMNVTEILTGLGWGKPSKRDLNTAGKWFRNNGYTPDSRKNFRVELQYPDHGYKFPGDDSKLARVMRDKKRLDPGRDY